MHVGYATGNAYRCYIPELKRVFVSKDGTFLEKLYRYKDLVTFEIGSGHKNSDEESLSDYDNEYQEAIRVENEGGIIGDNATEIEGGNDAPNPPGKSDGFENGPWKVGYHDGNGSEQDVGDGKGIDIQKAPEKPQKKTSGRRKSGRKFNKPNRFSEARE